jgi:2-desacetyl-2-hydroxyethyl bacteriochlorophyllide A dehydrogenase
MKALIINNYGGPEQLHLQEVPLPSPSAGEALIRVHAAGINPVDYKMRNGSMRIITGNKFPLILGFDIAGVIEQTKGKSEYRPGDKVFSKLSVRRGGYAEFATASEKHICHIPAGLTMAEAAATPLASLTALQGLQKGDPIKPDDKVLINGASGGVGSFAVQIAKAMGAYVTAVCSERNIQFVKDLGADHVIDYNAEDFTKTKTRYKKVFDAVAKSSFSRSGKILEYGGIYITTIPNKGLLFHRAVNFLRKTSAEFILTKSSGNDLRVIADYIKNGQVRPYVQKEFPLQDGARAHEMIETNRVRGKLVLKVIA